MHGGARMQGETFHNSTTQVERHNKAHNNNTTTRAFHPLTWNTTTWSLQSLRSATARNCPLGDAAKPLWANFGP